MGNKAWTLALEWGGKEGFEAEGDHPWVVNGKEAGLARTHANFTFLQVYEAGHMVPLNQVSPQPLTLYFLTQSLACTRALDAIFLGCRPLSGCAAPVFGC